MKTATFFVFAIVIGSVVYVEGKRIKRNLNEYCALSENLRSVGWYCIVKYLPDDEKLMIQTLTSCFGKTSFDQVLNLFCGLNNQQRYDVILAHIHCFQQVDMDSFAGGPTLDKENTSKCVSDNFPNSVLN